VPDTQIHPTGDVAAPADYLIPASAELMLKMAFARFDGTGAASSFKPCLRIISDAGTVAGEATADDTVAAGGSADVTWFLGKPSGAAAAPATAAAMPYASAFASSYNWTTAGSQFVLFDSVATSDPSVFLDQHLTQPGFPILILKAGIYLAWAGIGPWNPAWGTQAQLSNLGPDFGSWAGMGNAADNYPVTFTPVGGVSGASPALLMVTRAIYPADPPGGGQVNMEVVQNSGATRNVSAAITIIRLTPNGAGI
jgi:hypothetical protein